VAKVLARPEACLSVLSLLLIVLLKPDFRCVRIPAECLSKLLSVFPSVWLYAYNSWRTPEYIFMKFGFGVLKKLSSCFIFNLEWIILTITLYEDLHLYLHTWAVTTLLWASHAQLFCCFKTGKHELSEVPEFHFQWIDMKLIVKIKKAGCYWITKENTGSMV